MSNLQLTQEKLDALRSEYKPRRPCALLKYPRPKTKPEYLSLYPWLILDETDPHFVFCAVCECRLSAKRSDLGKHEGSIKHSENAQRKSAVPLTKVKTEGKWDYNDDDDGILPMHSFAGDADLCKAEVGNEDDDDDEDAEDDEEAEANEDDAEAAADEDDDEHDDDDVDGEGDGDGDNDGDADDDADDDQYEPKSKRSLSETDSQHSGMLEFLPLQVTINELPHAATPGAQLSAHCQPSTSTPQPCRITIKKVPAPAAKMAAASTPASSSQCPEITSKATITPIVAGCYTPAQRQALPYATRQLHSYQLQHLTSIESHTRDSLDLFFDSICATVKTLPPKLATEGKMRVMQLIGELELRAINEREAHPSPHQTASPVDIAASTGSTDAPGSSQQNATVASTTK